MNLYVDPASRDLTLEAGELRTVSGAADIAESVQAVLLTCLEEWVLDLNHGTNYIGIPTGDPGNSEIKDIVSAAIYQEPEVQTIDDLQISRDGRWLEIRFRATLKDGSSISGEVQSSG